jgi:hypothetical protein
MYFLKVFLIKSFKKYILKNIFSSQFQTPLVSESTLGAHNVTILESDHYVKLQSEGQDFISVLISFKSSTLDPLSSLSLSLSLSQNAITLLHDQVFACLSLLI